MKTQIELMAIKQQLEYTLEEVHKKRSDKNLMHDWLTDALSRVKKLTMPRVIKSVCKCENSTWNRDAGCMVCDECGEVI